MNSCLRRPLVWLFGIWASYCLTAADSGRTFVNFETAPVHPIAISTNHRVLALCNLPDGRLNLFDVEGELPVAIGSIFTGLDPVSVRFRTTNEVWVVNTISDSVSVVDIARHQVVAVIHTLDAPADVVFAGTPEHAFVSCAGVNTVQIFDAKTRVETDRVLIEGDRPKSMALSPAGKRVYVGILESGNASTILAPGLSLTDRLPPPGPVGMSFGPHKGLNPPPNLGDQIFPPINPKVGVTNQPPRVSHIVKRNAKGRWMDDNLGDWTEFISGTNAVLSGRVPGWDMPDQDVAILDLSKGEISYVTGLMNIVMSLAVNPVSGRLAVVGTDGLNEVRFEPNLKGIFNRVLLGLVDVDSDKKPVLDLNPHLTYKTNSIPLAQRRLSVGDPRGALWNDSGTRLYVTGMGSDNLVTMDENGNRTGQPLMVGEGPTGLALDEPRHRLYVYNRFGAGLAVVDTESMSVKTNIPLFDPTPTLVKRGRRHFYNTFESSGLGQAACASCHIDGRFDRLAWDLGSPLGEMKKITKANYNFARLAPASTNDFHPMKGPMVTQTLVDITGHEPFHWRADRNSIEEFNVTFQDLQAADAPLTPTEMLEFKEFLASLFLPPNRFRNPDNTLPTRLDMTGHFSLGRGRSSFGDPLPPGNAVHGVTLFRSAGAQGCVVCHTLPTGLGTDMNFVGNTWIKLPLGTNGEHHVALVATNRSLNLPFKIAQLRGLQDKMGFDLASSLSLSGFGFGHDGRVDTLVRFIQDGFDLRADQDVADMIAFLLCFSGSDLPEGTLNDPGRSPGVAGRDVPASVGALWLITQALVPADLSALITRNDPPTGRVDFVARAVRQGRSRGWIYDRALKLFRGERTADNASLSSLVSSASSTNPLLVTAVPRGVGEGFSTDHDGDGYSDQIEIDSGTDPDDPESNPGPNGFRLLGAQWKNAKLMISWRARTGFLYQLQSNISLAGPMWMDEGPPIPPQLPLVEQSIEISGPEAMRYFRVVQKEAQ